MRCRSNNDKYRCDRTPSLNAAGGRPPFSARHRYPVLRPMPNRWHASTVPTPASNSRQYSDSTSNLLLHPRLPINTPQVIKECCDEH
jgi:hypothetical protein